MLKTHCNGELSADMDGKDVVVGGWIEDIRNLGGIAFIVLRDGTGKAQITLIKKMVGKETFKRITTLNRESVILVHGKVQKNDRAGMGYEILPTHIEVLSEAQAPLPLGIVDDVDAIFDTRLDNRFIDLRKDEVAAIFRIRSGIAWAIRTFFHERGFIEVNTPKIVASATEGGTSLFKIKYFERDAYLNQSPQLYKQILMATGFERVFEIGPAFRAEEHDTVRHLNEFTSVDIEVAFATEEDVMTILECLIKHVISYVVASCKRDLEILNIDGLKVPENKFPRVTYEYIVSKAQEMGYEIAWGEDIGLEALKSIVKNDKRMQGYYFITHWPTGSKPFYVMPYEDNPRLCKAFDFMYAEREITSGAQRIHNHDLLVKRIKECGLEPKNFEFYLKAFRYGMPPHAGWGLGLERLTMVILGLKNIREGVIFPRDRKRLVP